MTAGGPVNLVRPSDIPRGRAHAPAREATGGLKRFTGSQRRRNSWQRHALDGVNLGVDLEIRGSPPGPRFTPLDAMAVADLAGVERSADAPVPARRSGPHCPARS